MHKSTHSPRVWKYERATEEPQTRAEFINRTRFDGPNGCWLWTGTLNEGGYGLFHFNRDGLHRHLLAHRLALHLSGRPVPQDKVVDHLCRNRQCVNPDHLEIVDTLTNVMRGNGYFAVNARKTHCRHGHLLEGDNVRWGISRRTGGPTRDCRACETRRRRSRTAA